MSHVFRLADVDKTPTGYVLVEQKGSLNAGRYAVQPRSSCAECYGRGFVSMVQIRTVGEGEEKHAVTETHERICGCVINRLRRTLDYSSSGAAPLPQPTEEKPADGPSKPERREQRRRERLQEEITAVETRIAEAEAAREQAAAPHLAHATDLERQATELREAESRRLTEYTAAVVELSVSLTTLDEAKARHKTAIGASDAAEKALAEAREALAPLAKEIEKAKDSARVAANRGGLRHRIQVDQARLDRLRAEVACSPSAEIALEANHDTEASA